jgi:hypothetical protein
VSRQAETYFLGSRARLKQRLGRQSESDGLLCNKSVGPHLRHQISLNYEISAVNSQICSALDYRAGYRVVRIEAELVLRDLVAAVERVRAAIKAV